MRRMLLFGAIAAALAGASIAAAHPGLKLDKQDISSKQCKPDGSHAKQLVDVHFTILNDADSGFNSGLAWANDTIDRHLRIWSLNDGTFCAQVDDHGKFVTYAGQSPGATNSVIPAGIKGDIDGGYVTTFFTGTYAPTLATHGNLGTYDDACSQSFICTGSHPYWANWFSSTAGDDLAQWGWIYKAGKHGTWLNQDDVAAADSGDIT